MTCISIIQDDFLEQKLPPCEEFQAILADAFKQSRDVSNYNVMAVRSREFGDTRYYFLRKHVVVDAYRDSVSGLNLMQQSDMVIGVKDKTYSVLKARFDQPSALRLFADYLEQQ